MSFGAWLGSLLGRLFGRDRPAAADPAAGGAGAVVAQLAESRALLAQAQAAMQPLRESSAAAARTSAQLQARLQAAQTEADHLDLQMRAALIKHDDERARELAGRKQDELAHLAQWQAQVPAAAAAAGAAAAALQQAEHRLQDLEARAAALTAELQRLQAERHAQTSLAALEAQLRQGRDLEISLEATAEAEAPAADLRFTELEEAERRRRAEADLERVRHELKP